MKNPSLTLLLLALTTAVVCGGLYYRSVAYRKQLQTQLATVAQQARQLQTDLATARTLNQTRQEQLTQLDADLGATKTRLTAAETRNVQLTRETTQLQNQLQERAKAAEALQVQLTDLSRALADAKANAASEEVVATYQATIARLERQLADAQRPAPAAAAVAAVTAPILTTSRARTASVVSVGPANAFVVLNYGASHGALPAQMMSIRRGTETVATVLISDVRENYSIAQVRPDSLRGVLHKGDSAILTQATP